MFLAKRIIYASTKYKLIRNYNTVAEIEIPTPWGKLAGKWWGPQDTRPILVLHGWQDNSGSFDKLMPFLPQHVGFFAVDAPGHGFSSQLHKGMFYHNVDYNILIKQIMKYFNWSKVSLMGHSLGAASSFIYTLLYPDEVDLLICLDALYFIFDKQSKSDSMANTIDKFLKYDAMNNKNEEPPSYTFEELQQLLHKGSKQSIDLESTKYILQRNVAPSKKNPNKFYVTRDPRLKVATLLQWQKKDILEGAAKIKCPIFLSIGKSSAILPLKTDFLEALDIIKKQNSKVEYHEVEGTHHLHLNTPEVIENSINNFINKYLK